jgi:hypothetical protein
MFVVFLGHFFVATCRTTLVIISALLIPYETWRFGGKRCACTPISDQFIGSLRTWEDASGLERVDRSPGKQSIREVVKNSFIWCSLPAP